METGSVMSKVKVYRALWLQNLGLKLIKKDEDGNIVKTIKVEFNGGQTAPSFKGGMLNTNNPEIQKLVESHPYFNKKNLREGFILESTEKKDVAEEERLKKEAEAKAEKERKEAEAKAAEEARQKDVASGEPDQNPETPTDENGVDPTDEQSAEGPKEIGGISTVNEASAWLRENFDDLTAREVNTKAKVLEVAKARNILFSELS